MQIGHWLEWTELISLLLFSIEPHGLPQTLIVFQIPSLFMIVSNDEAYKKKTKYYYSILPKQLL